MRFIDHIPRGRWFATSETDQTELPDVPLAAVFCPYCGVSMDPPLEADGDCPACQKRILIKMPPPSAVESTVSSGASSAHSRSHIVEQSIARYARRGYVVVRESDDYVEMRKVKKLSSNWLLFWTVSSLGTAIPPYLVWHAQKKEPIVIIMLDERGGVRIIETAA